MKTTHHRLVLVLALSLGSAGICQAVTVVRPAGNTATAHPTEAPTVSTGTITSIDVARGVMAVAGRVIHFTAKGVSFSDDRRTPSHEGLQGLKPGDKVTVRSVMRDGGNQAIQIVVKD
jgi:ribosomal protein S1